MPAPYIMWRFPPPNLNLSSEGIHAWCVSLDQPASCVAQLWPMLSPEEQSRASKFVTDKDKKRFVIGRGLLRIIVASYLQMKPEQLEFQYQLKGKPSLSGLAKNRTLHFNVSHSEDLAVYAITREHDVGIDVERIRVVPEAEQIASRFFSARESAQWRALPANQQVEAFLNYWTHKEAYLKAVGEGVNERLNQVEVLFAPGEPTRLLSVGGNAAAASQWCLKGLKPANGYVAALAVRGRGLRLACWQWPEWPSSLNVS